MTESHVADLLTSLPGSLYTVKQMITCKKMNISMFQILLLTTPCKIYCHENRALQKVKAPKVQEEVSSYKSQHYRMSALYLELFNLFSLTNHRSLYKFELFNHLTNIPPFTRSNVSKSTIIRFLQV